MTATERVLATFRFEPTDRIPRYEIFLDDFKRAYLRRYGLGDDYDVYDRFPRVDIGTILADQRGPLYRSEVVLQDDGDVLVVRDSWGRTLYQRRSAYFEKVLDVTLTRKRDLDTIAFDDPLAGDKYDAFERAAAAVSPRFAPVCGVLGLFMGSYRMRGEFEYLVDLAEDPGFCLALADRLCDYLTDCGLALARRTGCVETAMWVYDEFSGTRGPLFSPDTFARVFHQPYRRMISRWRDAGIHNIVLHCDGNSHPLLDMLLDAGFTALQGVAPSAGMWLPELRKRYGRKLVLIGGMDNVHTLVDGGADEIARQVSALVEVAQDGGVIIGSHSIDSDVSVGNYEAYSTCLDDHDTIAGVTPEEGARVSG